MSVLWLGSLVGVLAVVPVIGWLVAGIWSLLITLVTFQEVDGIERLQALALALGLAVISALIGGLIS